MSEVPVIPLVFDQDNARFVLLPHGKKDPPIEKGWQKKFHGFREADDHAKKGKNIGVMADGKYIGLDQDDPLAFDGLQLPPTTQWETRPGRLGFWLKCNDRTTKGLAKYGIKANQAQIKLFYNGKPVGEVKLERTYQVIPPSWKEIDGSRVYYEIVADFPPAEISIEWLLSELKKIGITFSEKMKCEGVDKGREQKYAQAALQNEISILSNKSEGERNNQLNKSAFALGQFVSAGHLEEREVVKALLKAAIYVGLSHDEIEKTIRSGLDAGANHPRKIPDSSDWRESVKEAIVHMAHNCDGARTKDKIGFNKYDAEFGKSLAEKIEKDEYIEDNELKSAYKKLKKYREQLSRVGITLPQEIPKSNSSGSMATLIVDFAMEDDAELWHTAEGKTYITLEINGHKEHYPLRSSSTESWLARKVYELRQKTPPSTAIEDALKVLDGKAKFEGPEYPVYVRVAPYESKIYVDLGSDTWEAIEISTAGWKIIKDPPVRFRRPAMQLQLTSPESVGSWEDLKQLLGIHDRKQFILIVAWIMQVYWPFGPYAHLILNGEQGSGKSGLTKTLKGLVDPSKAILRRPPRDEKDLMIAAQEERIIAYDNLSGLRVELSDCFCVLSTGGCLASRKLYTDDEEAFLVASRPIILNGIDAVATRGDLLDRSIVIDLPRIPESERIRDKDLAKRLELLQPSILGLILDATAMGLRHEKEITLDNLPRMADFASWIVACEPALPWKEGEFIEVYKHATEESMVDLVESDPFANAIIKFAQDVGTHRSTATALWKLLIQRESLNECHPPLGWPKNANGIKSKLKRIAPQLRKLGVGVEFDRSGHQRSIEIRHIAMLGDRSGDRCDRHVTAHNHHQVTEMTGVTAHSTLIPKKEKKGEDSGKQLRWIRKGDEEKNPSSLSLPSQDIESACHIAVTTPSSFLSVDEAPQMGPHPRKDEPTPNSKSNMVQRANELVARLESEGKPIIGSEVMKEFGVDYSKAKDILTEAGFKMTTDKDEIMGFRIWKRSL
ncbi:MAG TPA: hypothetical protein PLN83_11190 [Syntrophorhabdus sp.]|nr:hypothetical protein [Syntrophorhabdus sp.]